MNKRKKQNTNDELNTEGWLLVVVFLLIVGVFPVVMNIDDENQREIIVDQLVQSEYNNDQLTKDNAQLQSENTNLSEMLGQLNQTMFKLRLQLGFIDIAEQVASEHEWTYNQYMCGDFSNDLVKELRRMGWSAYREFGYHYSNGDGTCPEFDYDHWRCKHYWVIVKVPIEATSGRIISPEEYAREYRP